MKAARYLDLKQAILKAGFGEELLWAETVKAPCSADAFACEYIWVVLNSGMKNQIAQKIWNKVHPALSAGDSASTVFGHKGKAAAIDSVWKDRHKLFEEFKLELDCNKVEWLSRLPWIGKITKYHLAKNYGVDCCKPDRHLVRIANFYEKDPRELCSDIAKEVGDRVAVVDYVIWRAANLQLV
jgi:hypothetical protein